MEDQDNFPLHIFNETKRAQINKPIAAREIGDPFELYFLSSHCSAVVFLNTLWITPTYLYPLNAGVTKLNLSFSCWCPPCTT